MAPWSSRLFPGSPPSSRLQSSVSKGLSTYTKDETESLMALPKDHPRVFFASGGYSTSLRMPVILPACVVLEALPGDLIISEDTMAAWSSRLLLGFLPSSRLPGSVSMGLSTYTKDETESLRAIFKAHHRILFATSKDQPRVLFAFGGSSQYPRTPVFLPGLRISPRFLGPGTLQSLPLSCTVGTPNKPITVLTTCLYGFCPLRALPGPGWNDSKSVIQVQVLSQLQLQLQLQLQVSTSSR